MQALSHLTASGWVLLALMLAGWLGYVLHLVALARDGSSVNGGDRLTSVAVTAISTVWFIWLVTP